MSDSGSNLSRWLWDAERFGFTPGKLVKRLGYGTAPKVLCVSIPKSGTHLLERAVCRVPSLYRRLLPTINDSNLVHYGGLGTLLPQLAPGQVLFAHLAYTMERAAEAQANDVKVLFMIRDPRAVVCSQADYIFKRENHPQHDVFAAEATPKARIARAIRGNQATELSSVGQRLAEFSGWLAAAGCVVRFEDLVGPRGGGEETRQRESLDRVFDYLQVGLDADGRTAIREAVFSEASPTFSKGSTTGWKGRMDSELLGLMRETAGAQMKLYGYPDTRD